MLTSTKNDNQNNSKEEESNQFIVFILNEQKFGINVLKSREIIKVNDLTYIPESPDFIKGVITLREEIIPIIDLHKRFKLQDEIKTEDDKVIIISVNNTLIGLGVKQVEEIQRIESKKISQAPEITQGINQDYIQGIARLNDKLIILIDIDSIFSTKEIRQIKKLDNK